MKILRKMVSILMIIILITTDFSALGIGLKSYAIDNTENVQFSAYFVTEKGTKVEKINQDVTKKDLKLHLTVEIKNEGYFNGNINISDANFKFDITQKIENTMVAKIEEKLICLKQINAGESVDIEVPIKVIDSDEISRSMLFKDTILNLEGTYIKANAKADNIRIAKTVTVNIVPSENVKAELETSIITNQKTEVSESIKRIIQIYIKTKLANNEYPVKKTEINIETFEGIKPEKVEAMALKTTATNNGDTKEISNILNDNGNISFSIENKENDSKIISWKKNTSDEFVVTLTYDENMLEQNKIIENSNKIDTQVSFTLQDNEEKIVSAKSQIEVNEEKINSLIVKEKSSKTEMYKGKLYANTTSYYPKDISYMDTTTVYLTTTDIFDSLVVIEDEEMFVAEQNKESAYSLYKTTQINKAQILDILGENGELSIIYDGNIFTVNKDTEVNEAGNIILTYSNEVRKIGIITTKPEKTGKLEFIHTKALESSNGYSREQLKLVTSLQNVVSVTGVQGKKEISTSQFTRNIDLKETETKAELTIVDNKGSLSTLQANKLVLGVKLVTDGEKYDLFKNTVLKIKLPDEVEEFELTNADKLYADGFSIVTGYDRENKIIVLALVGEQVDYPETLATQVYLQLELTVKLSKTTPSKLSKISMEYMNENATQYHVQQETAVQMLDINGSVKGYTEQKIEISSPTGVVTTLNSSTYGIQTMTMVDSEVKTIEITKDQAGTEANFDLAVINNTQTDMKNAKILVQLPTCGQKDIDTLKTKLKNIEVKEAKIYYTQNANATADITNIGNNWRTDLDADSKKVLIVLDNVLTRSSSFISNLTLTLPEEIPMNVETELKYKTIYDTDSEKDIETESKTIKIITPKEIKMEASISATIGGKELKQEDKVKVGEIIKYSISVKNLGSQTIRNVTLTGEKPEGTTLLDTNISTIFTIEELKPDETYVKTYEVKISDNIDKISNKATAMCDDVIIESSKLENKIENANLSVIIEKDSEEVKTKGSEVKYWVEITNLTREEIKNTELYVTSTGIDFSTMGIETKEVKNALVMKIDSIQPNETETITLLGNVIAEKEDTTIYVSVKDEKDNIYTSNTLNETVVYNDASIELSSPQENSYVEQGGEIQYNIVIQNTGTGDISLTVKNNISEYISVQRIEINGKRIFSNFIKNDFSYSLNLLVGEKVEIKVIGQAQLVAGEKFKNKEISDVATISIGEKEKKSKEIKFFLKGIEGQNYNRSDSDNNSSDDNGNISAKYSISGVAWLDENMDGSRNDEEKILSGIKVRIFDISKNNYLKDNAGNAIEVVTGEDGKYKFTDVAEGQYILVFDYDTKKYELTTYKTTGVAESRNSKVVLKTININGQEFNYGVTDILYLQYDAININIGLKVKPKFDLELNKYVNKITIQGPKGTKTYDFNNKTLAKVEIDRKQLNKTNVIVEYKIQVKNTGDVEGYASTIVDYLPTEMAFRSELNSNWYLIDGKLYTKELEKTKIQPGEIKEVTLVLTKQMSENNVGLINNIAEIYEDYNEYGISDIDSTPNNKLNNEDDMGFANVYIAIKTGAQIVAYIILIIANIVLIISAIKIVKKKKNKK